MPNPLNQDWQKKSGLFFQTISSMNKALKAGSSEGLQKSRQ